MDATNAVNPQVAYWISVGYVIVVTTILLWWARGDRKKYVAVPEPRLYMISFRDPMGIALGAMEGATPEEAVLKACTQYGYHPQSLVRCQEITYTGRTIR